MLDVWINERNSWLKRRGIDPSADDWQKHLQALGATCLHEFQRLISDRWNEHLDACHGACVLRQPRLSQIVADSLAHFDGDRYELTDFVIMPNHVHLLAAFSDEHTMLRQCDSWKHFTATEVNRVLRQKGRFWQQDGFDHLVRSADQFEQLRRYIAENPRWASLRPGEYLHWTKPM